MSDEWFKEGKDTRAVLKFFITLYNDFDKGTRKTLVKTSLDDFVGAYTVFTRVIEKAFLEEDRIRLRSIFSQCSNMSWIGNYIANIKRFDSEYQLIAAHSFGSFLG